MDKPLSTSEWVKKKIEGLRIGASVTDKMPASLHQNLQSTNYPSDQLEKTPYELAQEAVNGVDIEKKYPKAYQKLLTSFQQQQSFLLHIFQHEQRAHPTKEPRMIQNENRWSIYWHSSANLLRQIFAVPQQQATYRRSESWLTNNKTTLYKGRIQAGDTKIALILEGSYVADKPNELQLSVAAAANPPLISLDTPLKAHISWGEYDNYIFISDRQSVNLPPVALDSVFDQEEQCFTAGLHFTLEPLED